MNKLNRQHRKDSIKVKVLFIVTILVIFLVYNIFNFFNIDISYYGSITTEENNDFTWWEVIRSKEELQLHNKYLKLDVNKLQNIDFEKYAIIISSGRKIDRIVYRKKHLPFIVYNYSGIAYLQKNFYANTFFVYLIPSNKRVFVDRHFVDDAQYIIE